MKTTILSVLAALFLSGAEEHGGKVAWVRDPQFGLAKAKLEGRAVMLFFTADW